MNILARVPTSAIAVTLFILFGLLMILITFYFVPAAGAVGDYYDCSRAPSDLYLCQAGAV